MRRIASHVLTIALCAVLPWFAVAQPTGNPKGTAAPSVTGESAKPSATRARPVTKTGPVSSDQVMAPDSRAARSGNLRTPGVGSPGELAGRQPGQQGGPTETNQTPRPAR